MEHTNPYKYSINGTMIEDCSTFSVFLKKLYLLKDKEIKVYLNVKGFDSLINDNPIEVAVELSHTFDVILDVNEKWQKEAFANLFRNNERVSVHQLV